MYKYRIKIMASKSFIINNGTTEKKVIYEILRFVEDIIRKTLFYIIFHAVIICVTYVIFIIILNGKNDF